MLFRMILTFSGLLLLLTACTPEPKPPENMPTMYQKMTIAAPVAAKIPKELTIHGDTRTDDYYWLNDRENPEVIAYLNAENAYQEAVMADTKDFQEKLFQEMKGRIKEDDESVPYKDNGYFYLTRYEEGKEYPIYSRKKDNLQAPEEVMLNVNDLAKGYSFFNVAGQSVSPSNELLAYGEDTLSRRIYTIRFKNLKTGEMLADEIPNTTGGAVWSNDNKYVFYSVKDETLRPVKVYRHQMGTPSTSDKLIYEEKDDTFSAYVYKTKSKKYVVIGAYQTLSQEYRVLNADNPTGEFRLIQPRERGLEYSIGHFGDKFYIRTNLDARNFRLMSTPENATTKENWTEVIPNRDDVLFEDMDMFKNYLVLSERKNGITQLRIRPWSGAAEHYIEFGEAAYVAATSTNPEFDTDVLRISYQSMTTPVTVYDYDMGSKQLTVMKQQEVLGDFDPANYESERLYATARDGAKVPISIVYRKGYKKDGQQPLLLYGYGSYGASMDPYFSSARLSLLDRGFAFAIAHIRGGEEMGRHWYEDGKLLKKKNTFNDFIDCGEFLIQEKYTGKDHLFAQGGSAGGLLMGAVINMRPDLWKGVIAAVPFVDVITTMLDESIPLTTGEYDEWGNPNEKQSYDYMLSYSPYDQVEAKDYPAMLVTTGLHDSQVQYWEPAKWVAKLREMKTDKKPLLLHTNMDAGHGGSSGRFERLKEVALEYTFLLDLAGKTGIKG
ncbi:MAG: oligopeptidase B [Bacteroidetes bacterium]|nr:MAG: oligopeptidase B [Bacteroidota bacterium]PTM14365.1 MAG: oligopeptidase B [Bacteroidota bacterium]